MDGGAWSSLDPKALEREDRAKGRKPGYVRKVQQFFNVAVDGKHDARTMTWYNPGTLELSEGKHTIRFSLGGDEPGGKRFAALDCFVLTTGSFTPNFQYKPGEQPKNVVAWKEEETWPFQPGTDQFSADAQLDLRGLNEEFAGEHGFIRLSEDGNDFVRGDGQPIRFWGGSDYTQRIAREKKSQAVLEHHARFLAKRGVNIVRLHGAIQPKQDGQKITDVDEKELDEIYRLVAGMKKAGIYTIISPYWGSSVHPKKSWGVADAGNGSCTGLVFLRSHAAKGLQGLAAADLRRREPVHGRAAGQGPGRGDDSDPERRQHALLDDAGRQGPGPPQPAEALRRLARQKVRLAGEGPRGLAGLPARRRRFCRRPAGHVHRLGADAGSPATRKGNGAGREARLADQAEFVGRMMYDFNREIARYLREELGCKQLVNAGNWRTADQMILDDVERWSYTANDVIGKNHYFAGLHNGINVGWQILPGQVFTSRSFTKEPTGSPLCLRQVVGHPFIVSESLWVPPTRYESEGPLVVAAQSCLTGLDTFYWFATGVEEWQTPINKWTFSVPMTLGQFPAAALLFRKGYVKEGPAVVHEERTLDDVFHRRLPLIAEEGAWDPNRDKGDMPQGTPFKAAVDPLGLPRRARGGQVRRRPGQEHRRRHVEVHRPGREERSAA